MLFLINISFISSISTLETKNYTSETDKNINMKVEEAIQEILSSIIEKSTQNISHDTKGDPNRISKASADIAELQSRTKYGILRCDYEYQPTRGDPGEPSSFYSDSNIVKVEGWTFEAVQRGMTKEGKYPASEFRIKRADGSVDNYWKKLWDACPPGGRSGYRRVTKKYTLEDGACDCTQGYFEPQDYEKGVVYRYEPDVIEQKMKETVLNLEKSGVCGITADVGYSQAFQENVCQMASVPVVLSSLQQLSFVSAAYDVRPVSKNKILVMTANSKSFDMDKLIPPGVDKDSIKIVGAENGKFGQWVINGNSFSRFQEDTFDEASVEGGLESMCELCQNGIAEVEKIGGKVVCIVQECAEMPAYSNGLRKRFNLPVYDTMTAIQFVQMGRGFNDYSAYIM